MRHGESGTSQAVQTGYWWWETKNGSSMWLVVVLCIRVLCSNSNACGFRYLLSAKAKTAGRQKGDAILLRAFLPRCHGVHVAGSVLSLGNQSRSAMVRAAASCPQHHPDRRGSRGSASGLNLGLSVRRVDV